METPAKYHPPWTTPPEGGLRFTVPEANNAPDLHGDLHNPDLVIFFGGNQFMALPEVMKAFLEAHPHIQRVYFETLPPGIVEQHLKRGSLVIGNLVVSARPDLFVAGKARIQRLADEGFLSETKPYFRNRLAIMVRKDNQEGVRSLNDLGRKGLRVSMPNPETEGIATKILEACRKAGGEGLVKRIMEEKVRTGEVFVTQIHHRQTPMRIMANLSDAGPVWHTEAVFQERIGSPISGIEIPKEHNVYGTTAAGVLKEASHREAASLFFEFLLSDGAQSVYRKYDFLPVD